MADRRQRFNRRRHRGERRPPRLRRPGGGGRTGGAAAGVELDVSTPLDTIANTAALGETDDLTELDVLEIRLSAAREAWGSTGADASHAPDRSDPTLTKK